MWLNNGDTEIQFDWITNNSPLIFTPKTGIINNKPQTTNIKYIPENASCIQLISTCDNDQL